MNLRIPVLIHEPPRRKTRGDPGTTAVRPLFFPAPAEAHVSLRHALGRLRRALRASLQEAAQDGREDAVAELAFHPEPDGQVVEVAELRDASGGPFRVFCAVFRGLDRRLAFLPDLEGTCVSVERGESPEARVTAAVVDFFRRREREGRAGDAAAFSLSGRAWITTVDVEYESRDRARGAAKGPRLALGVDEEVAGWRELQTVGRDLTELYPDELARVWFREPEVETLRRLLDVRYVRPVLLLGDPGAGKTALVHEYVRLRCDADRKGKPRTRRGGVWHLQPQRLISGMSYVGQWEQRLHAILHEADKQRHILFFDDLVGLFHAGISAGSRLTVGHVLKEALLRTRIRVVGEAAPEAYRVLREVDRGFADLFRVVPVAPLDEARSLRVLVRTARALEPKHRRTIAPGAYPAVLELQRRYVTREALPGKAVRFLERVCSVRREGAVSGPEVIEEFARASGLNRRFLDAHAVLEPREVREFLRARIVGQDEAVEAMVDVVARAKARLNEPGRPLGTLLFLGPTGVGKTECARALAEFLFGRADRMLRFDMNEHGAPGAAARLAGDRWSPEGSLTGAVRRQPFAVVLLDEIEKAHPEVHDLLLQVLGEGRLTNARGETADFGNAAIILTSNLGTGEAGARIGLKEDPASRRQVFLRAAERFFRPEFFNRLDRVVPFDPLRREEVRRIADLRIREVSRREGFARRRVLLDVHSWAMDRVAEAGYHPQLGARALKREIEEAITRPAAVRLAAVPPERPTLIRMFAGAGEIVTDVQPLFDPEPCAPPDGPVAETPAALVERLHAELERVQTSMQRWKPVGSVALRDLSEQDKVYFAVRRLAEDARVRLRRAAERVELARKGRWKATGVRPLRAAGKNAHGPEPARHRLHDFTARLAFADQVRELVAEIGAGAEIRAQEDPFELAGLQAAVAHLRAASLAMEAGEGAEVLIFARERSAAEGAPAAWLLDLYARTATEALAGEVTRPASATDDPALRVLGVSGPGFSRLLAGEEGTHLLCRDRERMEAVQVRLVRPDGDAEAAMRAFLVECRDWLEGLREGRARLDQDPLPVGRAVRFHHAGPPTATIDLRTGLTLPRCGEAQDLRAVLLAGLAR